jgi:hypothetical protein
MQYLHSLSTQAQRSPQNKLLEIGIVCEKRDYAGGKRDPLLEMEARCSKGKKKEKKVKNMTRLCSS